MADDQQSPLVVRLDGLDRELTNLEEWEVDAEYLTSTDGFRFVFHDPDPEELFGLEMANCELLVNGASQLLGRISKTVIGDRGLAVTCMGTDYVGDLVECNVDPTLRITEGMPLSLAVLIAASPVGITTVFDEGNGDLRGVRAGVVPPKNTKRRSHGNKKQGDYKPQPGQGIYDFINKLASRNGCTVQPGPTRDSLVLTAPRYSQASLYSLRRSIDPAGSAQNNMISATATRDFSKFPTVMIAQGYAAKRGEESKSGSVGYDMNAIIDGYDKIIVGNTFRGRRKPDDSGDSLNGSLYRLLVVRDDQARTVEQIVHAGRRAIAERFKDTLEYTATVRGHIEPESGAVWAIDAMCDVDDDLANVHETLWVAKRTLKYSRTQGATTDLTLWRPNSFVIGDDTLT